MFLNFVLPIIAKKGNWSPEKGVKVWNSDDLPFIEGYTAVPTQYYI